ncbi:MAG: hypothetical protein U1F43_14095 [Myxococcota bacterium]
MQSERMVHVGQVVGLGLFVLVAACGDDAKRPVGEACTENVECEGGVCGGGFCLDPAEDNDQDGLINRVEAGLKTDPVTADSDGDGLADGAEVGADPAHPADSDGDGRIDARESATADCDLDQVPDQADADDGLDQKGICHRQVVSPCQDLCDVSSGLSCPGSGTGCLSACSQVFSGLDAACQAKFATAGQCVADSTEPGCPAEGSPAWQLTPLGTFCANEIEAVSPCLQSAPCEAPVVVQLDVQHTDTLPKPDAMLAFSVALAGEASYEIAVSPAGQADDPTLVVFASTADRCAWIKNPLGGTQPLGISDNDAGFDEIVQLAPGPARTIDILVVNASATGATTFTLDAHELGI